MEQLIRVGETNIHVTILGEGPALLLLPGMGEACPQVEMKPFAEKIADCFRVVIFDPPGYGKSDPAATPRTIENMSDEFHAVMQALGCQTYAIAAHSISGIYALYHMKRYRDEVSAFIGLDISVAQQFANDFAKQELKMMTDMRTEALENHDPAYEEAQKKQYLDFLQSMTQYPFSAEDLAYYGDMVTKTAHDATVLDEIERVFDNAQKAAGLRIPADCPSLMLVAQENTKRLSEWEAWHRELCGPQTRFVVLPCDHYVHLMQTEEAARLIKEVCLT